MHECDKKRAKQSIQHIGIYFSYIGRFENNLTQLAESIEEEILQMREEIEEAQKRKRACLSQELLKGIPGKAKGTSRCIARIVKQNNRQQKGEFVKTGLTKQEKTTDIWFDKKVPFIHIRTHNTDLKNRLTTYSHHFPSVCKLTDSDPETGCMEFEIAKGRFSFHLTG